MTVKTLGILAGSGIGGGVYCLAAVALVNAMGISPTFPAYGGEDDFNLRFLVYLAAVLPSFIAMGVLIAVRSTARRRSWQRMILGGLAGTVATFTAGWLLSPVIGNLSTRDASNGAALAYLAAWTMLTLTGILLSTKAAAAPS